MENCANEWNLILFDRYTPVNDKIGYGKIENLIIFAF